MEHADCDSLIQNIYNNTLPNEKITEIAKAVGKKLYKIKQDELQQLHKRYQHIIEEGPLQKIAN